MRGLNALLAVLGASLAALVLCGLLLHTPSAGSVDSIGLVRRFVAVLAVAAVLYLAAVWLVLREGGDTATLAIVLGAALLARVPALVGPPLLSSDLYCYIWDGRVQLAGFNPYRYIPADPALAALRDRAIFDHVNRRFYAHTIYPPAAQLMFRLVAAISQTPFAMKLASVGWEAVAVACLAATLRLCGQPPARVLLYAWNPVAIWSFAGNGHVDAEAIAFIAVALFARAARRDGWAGAALGAATLVKFLPAAIVPALWRGRWRLPVVAILTIVLLYLPFIAVGPRRVLGFLGGYGVEEGLNDGQGIWLLAGLGDLAHLPRYAVPLYCIFRRWGSVRQRSRPLTPVAQMGSIVRQTSAALRAGPASLPPSRGSSSVRTTPGTFQFSPYSPSFGRAEHFSGCRWHRSRSISVPGTNSFSGLPSSMRRPSSCSSWTRSLSSGVAFYVRHAKGSSHGSRYDACRGPATLFRDDRSQTVSRGRLSSGLRLS
jgi:hypothetical protein